MSSGISDRIGEMDGYEAKRISVLAWFALLISLMGLVALLESSFVVVPIIGALLGAIPLVFSSRWSLGKVSIAVAFLAVAVGVYSTGNAVTRSVLDQNHLIAEASKFAREYIQLIQDDKIDEAYRLSSSQIKAMGDKIDPASMYNTVQAKDSERRSFEGGVIVSEVKRGGKDAKWTYLGCKGIIKAPNGRRVDIMFQDRSHPNPRTIVLWLAREDGRQDKPGEHLWFVAGTEYEKKE